MNIYLTGSSGFIGKHLNAYLDMEGHEVNRLVVRFDSVYSIDFSGLQGDAIVHLAGIAHDVKGEKGAVIYQQGIVELSKILIDKFLQSSIKDFIYISSVKAIADVTISPLTEQSIPRPTCIYGKAKLEVENYIQQVNLPQDKRIFIIRPAMVYGANCKGNLPALYQFIKSGKPYPFAQFDNKRNFLNINNLNYVITALLSNRDIASGSFNIADDESLSTVELIKKMAKIGNFKPRIWNVSKGLLKAIAKLNDTLNLPLNTDKLNKLTNNFEVDNSLIKKALQIQSMPFSLESGLKDMIESLPKNQ